MDSYFNAISSTLFFFALFGIYSSPIQVISRMIISQILATLDLCLEKYGDQIQNEGMGLTAILEAGSHVLGTIKKAQQIIEDMILYEFTISMLALTTGPFFAIVGLTTLGK